MLKTSKLTDCINDGDSTKAYVPLEAGLYVNLHRFFAGKTNYFDITHIMVFVFCCTVVEVSAVTEGSQEMLQVKSFHPGSLHLPAANCLSSEFYAKLHQ